MVDQIVFESVGVSVGLVKKKNLSQTKWSQSENMTTVIFLQRDMFSIYII